LISSIAIHYYKTFQKALLHRSVTKDLIFLDGIFIYNVEFYASLSPDTAKGTAGIAEGILKYQDEICIINT